MDFVGKAKRIDDIDLPLIGAAIGVGEDELHAFIDVETRGSGFDSRNRPRILFERHIFWRYLPAAKRAAAEKAGLASKIPGGYGKTSEQYEKLARAMKIDRRAALYACSWGLAQIMGFNHEAAGYATVEEMVEAFKDDEENHLRAAIRFITSNKLDDALRRHDWAAFARGYNGVAYRKNAYDTKLAEAYLKWSRIKDTPVDKPEVIVAPPTTGPQPPVIVVEDNPPPDVKLPSKPKGLAVLIAMLLSLLVGFWEQISKIIGG